MGANDNPERRAYMRWLVGAPVVVDLRSGSLDCRLKDISAGGAALGIEVPEAIGKAATLKISQTLSIASRIARVTRYGSGLEFLIDEAQKQTFTEYIINGIDPSDW